MKIDTCPYCSRMIYYMEGLPAEEEKNYLFDDFDATRITSKNNDNIDNDDYSDGDNDDVLESDDSSFDDVI